MDNSMVKTMVRLGLIIMDKETREKHLDALVNGDAISGPAVAALIDDTKNICYAMTDKDSEAVTEKEKIDIRWMLTRLDGKKVVNNMAPDELAEWVVDLCSNGTVFSSEELKAVIKSMMRKE